MIKIISETQCVFAPKDYSKDNVVVAEEFNSFLLSVGNQRILKCNIWLASKTLSLMTATLNLRSFPPSEPFCLWWISPHYKFTSKRKTSSPRNPLTRFPATETIRTLIQFWYVRLNLCFARYEKPVKNLSLDVAKKCVETYSSSNAVARHPEEKVN